jgi:hypothetical protein
VPSGKILGASRSMSCLLAPIKGCKQTTKCPRASVFRDNAVLAGHRIFVENYWLHRNRTKEILTRLAGKTSNRLSGLDNWVVE